MLREKYRRNAELNSRLDGIFRDMGLSYTQLNTNSIVMLAGKIAEASEDQLFPDILYVGKNWGRSEAYRIVWGDGEQPQGQLVFNGRMGIQIGGDVHFNHGRLIEIFGDWCEHLAWMESIAQEKKGYRIPADRIFKTLVRAQDVELPKMDIESCRGTEFLKRVVCPNCKKVHEFDAKAVVERMKQIHPDSAEENLPLFHHFRFKCECREPVHLCVAATKVSGEYRIVKYDTDVF
mgnify:CR=1 FL=1